MNENYLNICQTCLSCDRSLFPIEKLESSMKNLNVTLFNDRQKARICWECKAIIIKLSKFREQVLEAQRLLTYNVKNISPLSPLKLQSNEKIINFTYEENSNINQITSIKTESDENKFNSSKTNEIHEKIHDLDIINLRHIPNDINSNKSKKISKNYTKFKDKIKTITFTEDEMLNNRENKRNRPNFKKIPFKCESCVHGFTRKDTLLLHIKKKHHESLGQYVCPVCQIRFPTHKMMSRHKTRHYTIHKCLLCGYDTFTLTAAIKHCVVKHKRDTYGLIHCRQCEDTVSTAEELSDHIKTKHTLNCSECGEKFKGKHTLRTHIMRIHSSHRDFTCDICAKTFNTKSRLESHITSHNVAIAKKLSYCTICQVQYKNIYVYRNHLKNSKNHSERLYHCKECNKKFASKVYWKKHYDFYHLKKSPFKCESCNKLFMSDWRLKNHRQKHHGLNRTRDHMCNICGKSFYTQSTLRGHKLTHSDERTYMCSNCGDTFKQRPALYTHCKLVHRNEKN
ncbi:unnamed protein product, partial [Brenthis ino]